MKYLLKFVVAVSFVLLVSLSWASHHENSTKTNQASNDINKNAYPQSATGNTEETTISQASAEPKKQDEAPLLVGINKIATSLDQISKPNNTLVLWVQVLVFLLQLGVFGWQGYHLRRSVSLNRAWVFAGIGCTKIIKPGIVQAHPDHSNNGVSAAFVEHIYIDTWPRSKPLPQSPDYSNTNNIYPIMDPIQAGRHFKPIHRIENKEFSISEDTYVFGRVYYRDFFEQGPQRYSSFIYLIRMDKHGDHDRPLPHEVPAAYWEWT